MWESAAVTCIITRQVAPPCIAAWNPTDRGSINAPSIVLTLSGSLKLTFKTVFRSRHIYPMAIEAVASGKVNLKGIVTDIFELDEAQKAMDYSVNNKSDIVKAVIRIAG